MALVDFTAVSRQLRSTRVVAESASYYAVNRLSLDTNRRQGSGKACYRSAQSIVAAEGHGFGFRAEPDLRRITSLSPHHVDHPCRSTRRRRCHCAAAVACAVWNWLVYTM